MQNAWREGHPDINPHTPWQIERKRAVSAFAGTELDRLLRVRDLSTLALSGGITNFAVEGTARDASDRGYRVIVLEDCCESETESGRPSP